MKKKFLNLTIKLISNNCKYSQEQIEIITYGLESLYLTFTKLIIIFFTAYLLGIFKEMLLLLLTYNIIRSQAFGIHASKSIYCLISSLIMFIGGAIICKYFIFPNWLILFISVICNLCLMFYAPADTYKRPLVNVKKRKKFKLTSLFLGIFYTNLIIIFKKHFIVNYLLIGMFEACVMILPITYKIFNIPYNNYKTYNIDV